MPQPLQTILIDFFELNIPQTWYATVFIVQFCTHLTSLNKTNKEIRIQRVQNQQNRVQ